MWSISSECISVIFFLCTERIKKWEVYNCTVAIHLCATVVLIKTDPTDWVIPSAVDHNGQENTISYNTQTKETLGLETLQLKEQSVLKP